VDGPRFDRIARIWGTGTNRRRALRLIGSGVLASSWLGRGKTTVAQTSTAQTTCTQDADCADGDSDSCTGAACVDGSCTFFIVSCIPGTICCGNGECCPAGEPGGCLADTDCSPTSGDPCEGVRCESGGCVTFMVDCTPGFVCCGNGVCCPVTGACFADADCAGLGANNRCISGVCVP
jgi:hypothetical protein